MGPDLSEQDWLSETLAEAMNVAFRAGFHYRAALGKLMASHAVRGEKILKSSNIGGEMSRAGTAAERAAVLKGMSDLMAGGYSVSEAARKIGRAKGKAPKAISQIYYRYREQ